MRSAGVDPTAVGRDDEALRLVGTFIELHVEQGRGLVDLDRPIAVGVVDPRPHGRWRLDWPARPTMPEPPGSRTGVTR